MLTDKGLEIIAKYMLGHTQSYATHLAIGCGPNPTSSGSATLQPTKRECVANGTTTTSTLTFASHDFLVGDSIYVEGLGGYFNGTHTITGVTSTTIVYQVPIQYPSVSNVVYNGGESLAKVTTNVAHYFEVGDILAFSISDLQSTFQYVVRQVVDSTNFYIYDTSSSGGTTGSIDFAPTGFMGNYVSSGTVSKVLGVSTNRSLDFEMERFPISVRGIKSIGGVTNLVFAAEVPTQERYGITEVGLFSGLSNPVTFDSADSKMISLFTDAETWQLHTSSATTDVAIYTDAISAGTAGDLSPGIKAQDAAFIQSSNSFFLSENRVAALEQPRMYDSTLVVSGSLTASGPSGIDQANVAVIPGSSATHIHLKTNTNLFDFSKNSSDDEIRVAFSLLKANVTAGSETADPTTFAMKIVFTSESSDSPKSAMISINGAALSGYDKRYYVVSKKLSELTQEAGFSWGAVDTVKIFAYVDGSEDYMIALDGMRFENVYDETLSPYYGLIAYSETSSLLQPFGSETEYLFPVSKLNNSQNMIEFAIPLQIKFSEFTV